ncbi:hypothetical protein T08_8933, partial [Trichinella sp. T8]
LLCTGLAVASRCRGLACWTTNQGVSIDCQRPAIIISGALRRPLRADAVTNVGVIRPEHSGQQRCVHVEQAFSIRARLYTFAAHCTTLHCTTLHYTTLHCTTLHYTALHYTTLHYLLLACSSNVDKATTLIVLTGLPARTPGCLPACLLCFAYAAFIFLFSTAVIERFLHIKLLFFLILHHTNTLYIHTHIYYTHIHTYSYIHKFIFFDFQQFSL